MNNHVHIIWQIEDNHIISDVQHSFLKYTAQMMLKELRNHHPDVLKLFRVNAADRKYQIWERNALPVSLFSRPVFEQKLDYIHNNPVKANLVSLPEEYKYSSAAFILQVEVNGSFCRIMMVDGLDSVVGEEHQQRRKVLRSPDQVRRQAAQSSSARHHQKIKLM